MRVTKADYEDDVRMRIHQQIEHESIIAITKWLISMVDKILTIFCKRR